MGDQIMVRCGECDGRGSVGEVCDGSADYDVYECSDCDGTGERLAWCTEDCHGGRLVPATHALDTSVHLCTDCYHRCAVCAFATSETDRLPFVGGGVAHAACVMALEVPAPREEDAPALENAALGAHNEISTDGPPHGRMYVRSMDRGRQRRRGGPVPRMTARLIEIMHEEGFVTVAEAAQATGRSDTDIRDLLRAEALPCRRSGMFVFIERSALVRVFPHAATRLPTAGNGRAA
jgi:hypothetical protein